MRLRRRGNKQSATGMMLFLLFALLHISQQASGVLVEVNEGAESVMLPCQASEAFPNDATLEWLCDNRRIIVHLRQGGVDDHSNQNYRYHQRTTLMVNALQTGNLSLKLKNPKLLDTGNYTCMAHGKPISEVQLTVFSMTEQELKDEVDKGKKKLAAAIACACVLAVVLIVSLGLNLRTYLRNRKRPNISG